MEHTLTKITFEYALSNLDQIEVDALLQNELQGDEKIELLISLPDNRIKDILKNLGFKNEFLKTI